jgi:hypothetical protein
MSPSSSGPSSFNENPIELSHQHHIPILSHSPQFSSSLHNPTMPIQIPSSTSSNTGIPPASLPQLTGLFPITQSHSLPTYFLPHTNLAYFITNSKRNSTQPFHIITPLNHPSLHYPYSTSSYIQTNESLHLLQNKRHDSEENKQIQPMDTNKQLEEQLPFKKRRYTGQQSSVYSPMDTNHDDDETSNESGKK